MNVARKRTFDHARKALAVTGFLAVAAITYLLATWARGYPPELADTAVALTAGPPVLLLSIWVGTEYTRRAGTR